MEEQIYFHPNDVDSLILQGTILYMKFKRYKKAIEDFDKLLEHEPNNIDGLRCHGEAYLIS